MPLETIYGADEDGTIIAQAILCLSVANKIDQLLSENFYQSCPDEKGKWEVECKNDGR